MQRNLLPATGFIRIPQLIGQQEVTAEQAAINRERGKGPRTPRPAIPAILPWSKSKLWDAIKKNEFVKPVKLSDRITAFPVEDVRAFLEKLAA